MRWGKRFLHRRLVFIRETLNGSRDFAEAAGERRIPHFARAHTRFDQSAYGCGNCALARTNNFFARITLRESEAVTDRARISGHLGADKFAHLVYGETCSAVSVIHNGTLLIPTKSKRLVIHAIKVLMLDVVHNRLPLDRTAFIPACREARICTGISFVGCNGADLCRARHGAAITHDVPLCPFSFRSIRQPMNAIKRPTAATAIITTSLRRNPRPIATSAPAKIHGARQQMSAHSAHKLPMPISAPPRFL